MERNRNTGNRIFEIKLFALCMCGSDLIFVIENSLCEVINCFFGKLRGCDQSSFDSNCLNIIVNALIGACLLYTSLFIEGFASVGAERGRDTECYAGCVFL